MASRQSTAGRSAAAFAKSSSSEGAPPSSLKAAAPERLRVRAVRSASRNSSSAFLAPLVRWPGRIRARDRDRGAVRVRVRVRLRAGVRVRVGGGGATSDHAELLIGSLRPPDALKPHVQETLEPRLDGLGVSRDQVLYLDCLEGGRSPRWG